MYQFDILFSTRAADTVTRNQIGCALEDTSSSGDALREGILGTRCLAQEEQKTMIIERLKSGVITVGHGRGFVVEGAASASSSRPRTACRPSRRPCPLSGSRRAP